MSSESLDLQSFHYHLPEASIAKFPLENRSESKLLCYQQGKISHHHFFNTPDLLPEDSFLIFNDTKVIPARLIFHKETGARIEIFLLDPLKPTNVYEAVMHARKSCTWHVMIGNAKKWKEDQTLLLDTPEIKLAATRTGTDEVTFSWESDETFSDILAKAGKIPLPPYLDRPETETDKTQYQTVYSKAEGAVAAPTAGLHFTTSLLEEIQQKGISSDYLTLHVSAGTFQPIKAQKIEDHPMHREQILVSRQNILNLLANDRIIPVGTTSMRTLESLYWYGHLLGENPDAPFEIFKDTPYSPSAKHRTQNAEDKAKSLKNVLAKMDLDKTDLLIGHTEIFIYPGYTFRICKGLITNFHLPGSTLILLVAALIGEDWRKVYEEALSKDYRFLSFGDSSLLLP